MNFSRRFYKKVFLTYSGLLTIILSITGMIISSVIINDKELSGKFLLGFIIVGIIGLIMFIIPGNLSYFFKFSGYRVSITNDYKKVGVPNNPYMEYKLSYLDVCSGDITLKEVSKGVYQGIINDRKIVIDLKGWLNKKYYLYEYFLSIIQVELSKQDKKILKRRISCKHIHNLNLFIEDMNGKVHKKVLIKNYLTNPTVKFKNRINIKTEQMIGEKVNIKSLYDFD